MLASRTSNIITHYYSIQKKLKKKKLVPIHRIVADVSSVFVANKQFDGQDQPLFINELTYTVKFLCYWC